MAGVDARPLTERQLRCRSMATLRWLLVQMAVDREAAFQAYTRVSHFMLTEEQMEFLNRVEALGSGKTVANAAPQEKPTQAKPPTEDQRNLARPLAKKFRVALPDGWHADRGICSPFIGQYLPE